MYAVELIIVNKDGVRDPEGETIKRFVIEEQYSGIIGEVKAGKYVRFLVEAKSKDEGESLVKRIAEEKRLFGPFVHKIIVRSERVEDGSP
jgi:Phosphoribosylformylglycinamidine (FGAM) synthase, PurS component